MSIPLIDNGKQPQEHMHVRFGLNLPADTPYGNLSLKHLKLLIRLDHANIRIQALNEWFEERNRMAAIQIPMTATAFSEGLHISEEIVFNLRRVCDELITLICLKDFYLENQTYPTKLEIDSVGGFLFSGNPGHMAALKEDLGFLKRLNDISNAHKHSFLNTDYNLHERTEPFVFALGLRNNDLENEPDFHAIPVRNIVEDFNAFYKRAIGELKGWS